jgi:hypothetical protein
MSTPEPSYLTLSQVALRTARHPELLRQWCAAGRIPCRRVGGSWVVREEDLAMVDGIARRGRGTRTEPAAVAAPDPARRRIIAAVFDGDDSADAVADALRERLHVQPDAIGTTSLGVNGLAALRLTVVAGRFPEPASVDARRILIGYGGRIVADIDEIAAAEGELRFNVTRRRRSSVADDRRSRPKATSQRAQSARRSVPPAATR